MAIVEFRREFTLGGLRRGDAEADPIAQFKKWFDQATGARAGGRVRKFFVRLYKALLLVAGAEPMDLDAMVLATADKQGRPSARAVLLKGVDERGFIFYTNYESRKGQELAENPRASLVFYWADLERQVCVAGEVRKLPQAGVRLGSSHLRNRTRIGAMNRAAAAVGQASRLRWFQGRDALMAGGTPAPLPRRRAH